VNCTTSRAAPVLDAVCAGYFVANGIYWATVTSCDSAAFGTRCAEAGTKTAGVLLSAGLAVLCGLSAGSGFGQAARCQEVKDLNAGCMSGDLKACQQLRPGWVPTTPPQPPAGGSPWTAPPPPVTPPTQVRDSAPATPGCTKDTDCKGTRICVSGACVEPAH